ncbi:hypothetical protein Cs7R123_14750 [Catellatospora sp. TT07R-123]|uniref:DUF2252 family protein n=1 Tax=Catellatospora sp. TT07R-123 TaxID=2733863 RepID=UPI001B1CC594|nr:DUF2252 family protein [Catellatospora sp. TT07R-123]GHJ44133.1 hypothetical protein Cs7R123_14750 [Catellatospora sp. TT07R-123]
MRPLASCVAVVLAATLLTVPASPAAAALTRDPVAVVYARDHALHLLNGGATDDELTARTVKLASSAWAFFRGTSPLYYRDLGELAQSAYATGGSDVWLTGDAHLENTGADRGADNTEQYQLTDTDDAWRGSWTWELRREAVSIVLAGRANGRSASSIHTDVDTLVAEYAQWIDKFHGTSDELDWRLTASNTSDLSGDLIAASAADKRKDLLDRWTALSGSSRVFKSDPELQTVSAATRTSLVNAVAAYRTTAADPLSSAEAVVKDVRRRLNAGTGSLGRWRWYVLIEGDSTATTDDRILELKQAVDPAPKQLAPNATTLTGGQRPALALRWLVNESDPLAGWASVGTVPVLVKEKSPFAEDLAIADLTGSATWDDTVRDIGRLLAAAHSRADQDLPGTGLTYSADDAIDDAITSVSGLQSETRAFADTYADQATLDWQAYAAAKSAGRPLY